MRRIYTSDQAARKRARPILIVTETEQEQESRSGRRRLRVHPHSPSSYICSSKRLWTKLRLPVLH
jgi:hypothetical protein